MTAKVCIMIKSFEKLPMGHPHNTCQIGLPRKRILYTVLRSPHIDKKSREQFEMGIHKQLLVIETETHKLREKVLWLKLHHPLGVQLKIIFHYRTGLELIACQTLVKLNQVFLYKNTELHRVCMNKSRPDVVRLNRKHNKKAPCATEDRKARA